MAKLRPAMGKTLNPRPPAIVTSAWTLAEWNDYRRVEDELTVLAFDHRVLRPWANAPSFYVMGLDSESDVPAREGPVHLAAIDLWKYTPPLPAKDAAMVQARLAVIPRVLDQARLNLVGDIHDLWMIGVRNAASQKDLFEAFAKTARPAHPELAEEAMKAAAAFDRFGAWLQERLPQKKGRAGVGVANYDWYMKHVHLSPYTFADEVLLMERELSRARAYLALAENDNRKLPPASAIEDPNEFHRLFGLGVTDFMKIIE